MIRESGGDMRVCRCSGGARDGRQGCKREEPPGVGGADISNLNTFVTNNLLDLLKKFILFLNFLLWPHVTHGLSLIETSYVLIYFHYPSLTLLTMFAQLSANNYFQKSSRICWKPSTIMYILNICKLIVPGVVSAFLSTTKNWARDQLLLSLN